MNQQARQPTLKMSYLAARVLTLVCFFQFAGVHNGYAYWSQAASNIQPVPLQPIYSTLIQSINPLVNPMETQAVLAQGAVRLALSGTRITHAVAAITAEAISLFSGGFRPETQIPKPSLRSHTAPLNRESWIEPEKLDVLQELWIEPILKGITAIHQKGRGALILKSLWRTAWKPHFWNEWQALLMQSRGNSADHKESAKGENKAQENLKTNSLAKSQADLF